MSIAIHLSVYLRYLDSMNRPLLQNIIERFNLQGYSQTINMYSRWRLDVYCYSFVCISQIYRQHKWTSSPIYNRTIQCARYSQTFNMYSRWRLDIYCYSFVCISQIIDNIIKDWL